MFRCFFFRSIRQLIKYFLGVDAAAGHIPESAAAAVAAAAKVPAMRGMFKASEHAPGISCGQRFRRRHRGWLKLRGPQDENVFEFRKASLVLSQWSDPYDVATPATAAPARPSALRGQVPRG